MNKKCLIIIPAFNEKENIGSVLDKVLTMPPLPGLVFSTLVVDDGSSDGTGSVVGERAIYLRHPVNLGIGVTVQTGMRYANEHHFDYCVQLDGDGQHDPAEIQKLFAMHFLKKSNLTIGSRFLDTKGFKSSLTRRLGISIIRASYLLFYKKKVTDPTSGFRLMDRSAIENFIKYYPYDYPEPISIAYALNKELVVAEAGVLMSPRLAGNSSIEGTDSFLYMIKTLIAILLLKILRP